MQLVETSLDANLLNNAVKLRFTHCSVLPGGVTIQETLNNVLILITTNQSVHRLLLPHPTRMYRSVSNTTLMFCQDYKDSDLFYVCQETKGSDLFCVCQEPKDWPVLCLSN